jgi:hypothetical protein
MGVNTRIKQDNTYLNYLTRVINDGGSYEPVPLYQYKEQYDKLQLFNPVLFLFPSAQKNNNLYTVTPNNLTGFTMSRTSTGNYFNRNGNLLTAQNNEPRLSYLGSTRLFQGVLIEPSSTNRVLNNVSYSASWDISNVHQITDDLFLFNSGKNLKVLTNDSISSNATSMCIRQGITIFSGVNSLSFYVKQTTSHGSISVWGFESVVGSYSVNFDVNTLTVSRVQTSARYTNRIGGVVPLGNNIFYCYEIFTSSVSGSTSLGFSPTTSGSQTMVAGQEISISCIQLEGQYPTSFIPTTGTNVTRSVDSLSSPILNYNTNQWSVFFDIEYLYDFTKPETADVSANPLIWYFRRLNNSAVNFWNQNAQQNLGSFTFSPANSVKRFRCIISFNGSTINTFINGVKIGDQVTPTNPTPFQNFLNTNTYRLVTTKGNLMGMFDGPHTIRNMVIYDYQLNDEQSINLTRF